MSDAGQASADARCANCGAVLRGPFCAMCGQESKPLDPPVRHFIGQFAQELLDVDGRVPRSMRRLLFSPGFLTREHVRGRRAPWVSPLKLYLLASVAMFAMLALSGDAGGVQIAFGDDKARVAESLQSYGFDTEGELFEAVQSARATWMPRVMFALVPFFAWVVALLRRPEGRRYPAHLVFALHVHAAAFCVRAVAEGMSALLPGWERAFDLSTGVYAIPYLYLSFRGAYGGSRWQDARDTAIVVVVQVVALMAGTAAVVAAAILGPYLLGRLGL